MNNPPRSRTGRVVQIVWLLLATTLIAITAVSLVGKGGADVTICQAAATCQSGQIDLSTARMLQAHGVSIDALNGVMGAIPLLILTMWYGLGALVIWRKPDDRGAVLCAFFLVVFPQFLNQAIPFALFFMALILFGLLFPDGRFAPRWTLWLALTTILLLSISQFVSESLAAGEGVALVLLVIALQIYRFHSISSWDQRQQTKWTVFGLAAAVLGFIGVLSLGQPAGGSLISAVVSRTEFVLVISIIPVSIGISVLRRRLWDIDKVISRALAYTTLTILLAAVYIGSVVGLEKLSSSVIGSSSIPSVAISTLIVAALFGPLRRRIQTLIDRRFYRTKYDANRLLAKFGERLRDEVDLASLTQDLTSVVHDTLHPEYVSLWLAREKHEV